MGSKLRTFENGVSIPFCVAKGDILLSNSISLAQKEFLPILKSKKQEFRNSEILAISGVRCKYMDK